MPTDKLNNQSEGHFEHRQASKMDIFCDNS